MSIWLSVGLNIRPTKSRFSRRFFYDRADVAKKNKKKSFYIRRLKNGKNVICLEI
jgi:hypothetical protein